MTDARMPERYLNDRRLVRLSDGAFRAFVTAMMWSVANRTEGVIEHDDIALIPHAQGMHATELVAAGLWDLHEAGYLIIDFSETQTSKNELEALDGARRAEREKKARQRAHKRGDHSLCTPDTCDVSRGTVPGTNEGTTQDRTGKDKDRTGQASTTNHLPTGKVQPFVDTGYNEMQRNALASWNLVPDSKGVA